MISPETLKRPSRHVNPVVLNHAADFEIIYGARKFKTSLVAGTYVPQYEDAEGVFYKGPPDCIVIYGSGGPTFISKRQGGLWVKKSGETPKYKVWNTLGGNGFLPSKAGSTTAESNATSAVNDVALRAVAATPNATPVQAGVGTGIANGLIEGIIAMEEGKIALLSDSPPDANLDEVISK